MMKYIPIYNKRLSWTKLLDFPSLVLLVLSIVSSFHPILSPFHFVRLWPWLQGWNIQAGGGYTEIIKVGVFQNSVSQWYPHIAGYITTNYIPIPSKGH